MNLSNVIFKNISTRTIFIHIICWTLFIGYELTIVYHTIGVLDRPAIYLVYYPIHMGFFYAYISLLEITFNARRPNYLMLSAGYIILISIYLLIKYLASYLLNDFYSNIHNSYNYIQGYVVRNISRGIYFTVFGTFYWAAGYVSFERKQLEAAEKRQLLLAKEKVGLENQLIKSKNASLQLQINPHMLFNTLNFVFSKVQVYTEEGARAIWLLSEIMRYSIEETAREGSVLITQELEQIFHLLEINRYRFDDPLFLDVETEGDFNHYRIIPMILLTLTENIFKHGDLATPASPGVLRLTLSRQGQLLFFSRNLKKSKNDRLRTKRLGLENVRARLDTTYPGNYQLETRDSATIFELSLTLNL